MEAARRERAAADRDLFGVALDVADRIERDAEPFRDELREGGGMALTVRMRAGDDRDHAARIEAQLHPLVEHAAELDIGRHRAAAQFAGFRAGSLRRASKPSQSASSRHWSISRSNSPLS